jgi:cell volume regulation protein A
MSLRDVHADIVDYAVLPASPLVDKTVKDLRLPDGAILAMISRGNRLIAPRGTTELRPNDHLFIIAGADTRSALDQALNDAGDAAPEVPGA